MNPTARRTLKALLALVLAGGLAAATHAATYKFADQGDATSMDPHSLNESLQLSLVGNIYEPLVGRGKKLDDVLSAPQRAQMAHEIGVSRELQAEVELQARIDDSLRRSFAPLCHPLRAYRDYA